jgi:acetoin utilization deacetylase AcuC-like enzyme
MPIHITWHPSSLDHDPGPDHPESRHRIEAVLEALRAWPSPDQLIWHEAEPATAEAMHRVHTSEYLDMLTAVEARGGGRLDEDTVMGAKSLEAAKHTAGAAVQAAQLAMTDGAALAATRPPGHHALANRAMGFCLINNAMVAAHAALEDLGAERVLIVDWDVHHGNGTQALAWDEPRVRYVSLHQWPLYPGTGLEEERGVGNVFNVPRPPGLPPAEYVHDLNEAVSQATDGWQPDLLIISAGFDAMAGDPLAGFTLEPEHYAEWTSNWLEIGAPIVSLLEGGYIPQRLAAGVVAHLRTLSGRVGQS